MKKILSLLIITAINISGQSFEKEFPSGFSTLFKNLSEVNSYYFGGNPAQLNFSIEDELLSLSSNNYYDEGSFKKFIDPTSTRNYILSASGKKGITENQNFKGSFGFHRNERVDWQWLFTRDYNSGNPFLLGDSTTGKSRINGIVMNAEYSARLTENLNFGANLFYGVDEALKTVSPRPTAIHRDIKGRVGVNYSLFSNFSAGLFVEVADNNERISYREDEGAITQETIIMKFKGYDFPNIFRKKTETRYSYFNGYKSGLTFEYLPFRNSVLTGYFSSGYEKNNVKDDAISPKSEGFWSDDVINGGVQYYQILSNSFQIGLVYKLNKNSGWGKYSPYNVLYYDRDKTSHEIESGVSFQLLKQTYLGLELGLGATNIRENDHYSSVNSKSSSLSYLGRVGFTHKINDIFFSVLSYAIKLNTISEGNITEASPGVYYTSFMKYDLLFEQTEYYAHTVALSASYSINNTDKILLYVNYNYLQPRNSVVFSNSSKSIVDVNLEYRLKVY